MGKPGTVKLGVGVLGVLGVGVEGVAVVGLGVDAVIGGVMGAGLRGGVLWGVSLGSDWFLTAFSFRYAGGVTFKLIREGIADAVAAGVVLKVLVRRAVGGGDGEVLLGMR